MRLADEYAGVAGTGRWLRALLVVVAAGAVATPALRGSVRVAMPSRLPVASLVTDGDVETLAVAGNTVYAGGFIGYAGPRTGGFALVGARSGRVDRGLPPFGGSSSGGGVTAAIADGRGGWVVAGDFPSVGGRPCAGLARVTAAGRIDPRFCGRVGGRVWTLARSGWTLFLGGDFRRVDGRRRLRLAALDLRSGRLLPWQPAATGPVFNDRGNLTYPFVTALAVVRGRLVVGGYFKQIGTSPRIGLAAFDLRTLALLPWRADATPASPGGVGITTAGERVLVWGFFSRLAGAPFHGVGALSASSGDRLPWDVPVSGGSVFAVTAAGDRVFLAGDFSRVERVRRPDVAAVDARSGRLIPSFRAAAARGGAGIRGIQVMALSNDRLYLGGSFTRIGTAVRWNLAAVDAQSGRLLPWAPPANAPVETLTVLGNAVAVGGDMTSVGGIRGSGALALDGTSGRILPWRPRFDRAPSTFAVANGRLYVGGSFEHVNGASRHGLAAFDLSSGALTSWAPVLKPSRSGLEVQQLAADQGTIYVAGDFARADGVPRDRLAAFDATTGSLLPWNPGLRGGGTDGYADITSLQAVDGHVYLAGDFNRIAGMPEKGFAELDARTGALTAWQPQFDGLDGITTAYRNNETVYLGGDFTHLDGARRSGLAALDVRTHRLLPWAPALGRGWVSTEAHALKGAGSAFAVAGDFRSVDGRAHAAFALIEPVTGTALSWSPPPDDTAQFEATAVAITDTLLAFDGYAGGNADSINVYRLTDSH